MSNRPRRSAAPTHPSRSRPSTRSADRTVLIAIGVGAALVAVITIAVFVVSGDDDPAADQPDVQINGVALPAIPEVGDDPALGVKAPIFVTDTVDGVRVVTGSGGGPSDPARIVGFFAHWCEVCRQEVAWVSPWLAANPLPERIELSTVATFNDPARPNHPPGDWFAGEAWPLSVLLDEDATIASAYGVAQVPAWVVLDDLNRVLARRTGAMTAADFEALVALAESGIDA